MGYMKEIYTDRMELDEKDILAMQHENAMAAVTDLEGHLTYLTWRLEFYSEDVTLDNLRTISEDLDRIKKILL